MIQATCIQRLPFLLRKRSKLKKKTLEKSQFQWEVDSFTFGREEGRKEAARNTFDGLERRNPRSKRLPRGPAHCQDSLAGERLEKGAGPTCVRQLPAHRQHDLAVAGGVGHQLQHLLVGFALDGHSVDAQQLVSSPQAAVLLGGAQRHDGADVDLRRAGKVQTGGGASLNCKNYSTVTVVHGMSLH